MFVVADAKQRIIATRKNETLIQLAKELVQEAKRLGVSDEDVMSLIQHIQQEG